jgi:hypothetical protein
VFSGITLALIVALVAVAIFVLVGTVRGRPPGKAEVLVARVATGVLALHAVFGAVRAFTAAPPALPLTEFLIYLVVSVVVLPFLLQFATAEEDSRWGGAVIAVGAIGVAVAVWRIQVLWDGGYV